MGIFIGCLGGGICTNTSLSGALTEVLFSPLTQYFSALALYCVLLLPCVPKRAEAFDLVLLGSEIISHPHCASSDPHLVPFCGEKWNSEEPVPFSLSLTCVVTLREQRLDYYFQLAWLIALSHHLHTLTYRHSKQGGQLSTMPFWKSKNPDPSSERFPSASRLLTNTLQFTGGPLVLLFSPRHAG